MGVSCCKFGSCNFSQKQCSSGSNSNKEKTNASVVAPTANRSSKLHSKSENPLQPQQKKSTSASKKATIPIKAKPAVVHGSSSQLHTSMIDVQGEFSLPSSMEHSSFYSCFPQSFSGTLKAPPSAALGVSPSPQRRRGSGGGGIVSFPERDSTTSSLISHRCGVSSSCGTGGDQSEEHCSVRTATTTSATGNGLGGGVTLTSSDCGSNGLVTHSTKINSSSNLLSPNDSWNTAFPQSHQQMSTEVDEFHWLSQHPAIDLKETLEQCGSINFMVKMLFQFKGQFLTQRTLLWRLADLELWREFVTEVHGLKGATSSLFLPRLDAICQRCMKLGKACDYWTATQNQEVPATTKDQVRALLRLLDNAYSEFEKELSEFHHFKTMVENHHHHSATEVNDKSIQGQQG